VITTVLIDGQPSTGAIPVTDSAVVRGDGCFEALRSYLGQPFAVEEHLDRLERSAHLLDLPLPSRQEVERWIRKVADEVGDGVVRVLVTRGAGIPGLGDPPRVIVFGHTWDPPDTPGRLLPVSAPWHAAGAPWDLAGAKTISYAPNMAAGRHARVSGYDDALLVTPNDTILEGPTFSVAWVVDEVLETPGLELGILDSITRRFVLEDARRLGVGVREGVWQLSRLEDATEVMAVSTIREIQPVVSVGDFQFDEGPVTKRLAEAFSQRVDATGTPPDQSSFSSP
jgi:branched-subunit amino acid aminotransferase/4-amino-4-deoxychorismate lyase